ncbi:uncharacterized protein LOC106654634 [Trichogramma pretiosum]|uniref:uncharacterized protein LOC106654634 n=1 Tax=Trichogramma pretiosum TaxID=7493 RepID=UPI0006C972D6|nr:uncharacterized protein LOC106654634 [Trichogramma pretiosum]XP_014230076.1 uncharacterized protein LOC106654634 [Trichogramma pretiosum]XP_014230077.1 uncharacterized protein LOC106654634 [Trichogramma pretiosum]XP_023314918.1 uncharacterized protein LOC106654634 [Trichogramma pretiosum]
MYITCKCLNVSITTKTNELHHVNIDEMELNADVCDDSFFKNKLVTTKELENVVKEQPGLVETRHVGPWAIYRCYNCDMKTHAVHGEFGAAMVLMSSELITSEDEIKKLKASPNYSLAFRIVIKVTDDMFDPLETPTKFSVSQLSNNLRFALTGLEQQLEEAIQHQVRTIDKKIRDFTKEQYNILEEFRERVHKEHNVLTRIICDQHQNSKNSSNFATPPATAENISNKTAPKDDVDTTVVRLNSKNAARHQSSNKAVKEIHSLNGNNETRSNFDDEFLFELEGIDNMPIRPLQALEIESDAEDSATEVITLTRHHRSDHPAIAKSLPVTVPTFHAFGQRFDRHDDDEEQISVNSMDPSSIQASIKALAKSVHGDTVFGDLPRPRFSTQI